MISIFDFSDHISEGRKRMYSILDSYSRTKLLSAEFDPTSTCTDAFFFDGASNVQYSKSWRNSLCNLCLIILNPWCQACIVSIFQ